MLAGLSFPRGVLLLYINNLLMNLGFFALIPYLSLHVTENLGLSTGLAGALLMLRQMSQQGPTFFTGMVADRIGYRMLMCLGMVIRAVGFAMFAFVSEPLGLFVAAVVSGLGGALFGPTEKAMLTVLTPDDQRGRFYALEKVMGNTGLIGAAVLSAWLIRYDFAVLSLVCGGFYFLLAVVTFWRLPDVQVQEVHIPFREMLNTVLADRHFLQLVAVGVGFWFMFMQLYLAIPLYVVEVTGRQEAVSAVNLLLAALVIVLQYKVTMIVSRYQLGAAMILGLLLMGAGLLVMGQVPLLIVMVAAFVVFAFGIMIVEPTFYELTSRYAKREMSATYFGFAALAMGIGGGLSQGVGGYLIDAGHVLGLPSLLWWVCAAVALISAWGMYRLHKKTSEQTPAVAGQSTSITS